jgi:hypothetical protein
MASAATYTPIATYTVPSATATYSFTSVPSTFTDLVLIVNGTTSSNADLYLAFNSDSGTNYSDTSMYGTGSAAGSGRDTSLTRMIIGAVYPNSVNVISIQNYSNSTTYKTVLGRGNGANNVVQAGVGLWRNTSAISTITLSLTGAYTFSTGCTFTLYGILAA